MIVEDYGIAWDIMGVNGKIVKNDPRDDLAAEVKS
jgi:hypothetical protein